MPKVTRDRKNSHPTPTPATRVFQTSCNCVKLRPKVDGFSTSDSSTLAFACWSSCWSAAAFLPGPTRVGRNSPRLGPVTHKAL